jgi:hypothetical protein
VSHPPSARPAHAGRLSRWLAHGATAVAVLFLLFSGGIKFLAAEPVLTTFAHLGLPPTMRVGLGVLELSCTAVYALPRTRPLGAVLLTGYLGGAVVTHLRVGDPWLSHTLFPLYVGALLWTGLLLRDRALRAALLGDLLPRRRAL